MNSHEKNRERFNDKNVTKHYLAQTGLMPAEKMLFQKHITPGVAVLDLGVGGGRTTPYLSGIAGRYLGVDYAEAMVHQCKSRFPNQEFVTGDASDLSFIGDGSFDVVLFSFNGIDYLHPDEMRHRCFSEVKRVLKKNGHFIFSSHNARRVFVNPVFDGASFPKKLWRILRAAVLSFSKGPTQAVSRRFREGRGYFHDSTHGGIFTYSTTPQEIAAELSDAGLKLLEVQSLSEGYFNGTYFTPWNHYVAVRGE
jgi:ubiquinone/menaquinone biosynthesis C-methylase UbiE